MKEFYNSTLADIPSLKQRAKQRFRKFVFDYLEGGCFEEIGILRNRRDIQSVQFRRNLLSPFSGTDLSVELFGHRYVAPFDIAPTGLQGSLKCRP